MLSTVLAKWKYILLIHLWLLASKFADQINQSHSSPEITEWHAWTLTELIGSLNCKSPEFQQ